MTRRMMTMEEMKKKMIEYWQDGELKGLVEPKGAEEIKQSATNAGYRVYDGGFFFNVEYTVKNETKRGEFDDDNYF